MPKLSIIIPCYNCEKTLKEAVLSCYQQGFSDSEFEIVMVDDFSTDNTWQVMEILAKQHNNISLFRHEKNKGGGATRNTGIRNSAGEIIFCLDSDNFFAPNSIKTMIQMFASNDIDGVIFEERRFFKGTNSNSFQSHHNKIIYRPIELLDLINGSSTLLDNFFYTRKAFEQTKGYPEHHGFDTQCFEFRFIGSGFKAQVCPKSVFYHRQAGYGKSYFERVYESGAFSVNMYLILEEYLFLFSTEAREKIINFDVFNNSKLDNNLLTFLTNSFKDRPDHIFLPNYKEYCRPDGFFTFIESQDDIDNWILGNFNYQKGDYIPALTNFSICAKQYPNSKLLYFNSLRCLAGSAKIPRAEHTNHVLDISKSLAYKRQYIDLNPNLIKKTALVLKKLYETIC